MTFTLILAKHCHLLVIFSVPLRTLPLRTITSLVRLLSPIWCCYILYRGCFNDPSPNIPGLLPQFRVLHMILKWDAPKGWGSGPRTLCLPLCLFSSVTILKSAFAFFDYCSLRPEESTHRLDQLHLWWIKFNNLFLSFADYLSTNTHTSSEFADRLPEDAFKKPEHTIWIEVPLSIHIPKPSKHFGRFVR